MPSRSEEDLQHLEDAAVAYWNEFVDNYGRLPGRLTTVDLGDGRGPANLGDFFRVQKDERTANLRPQMQEILHGAGLGGHLVSGRNDRTIIDESAPTETGSKRMAPSFGMDSAKNRYILIPTGDTATFAPPPLDRREVSRARAAAARRQPTSMPGQGTGDPGPTAPEDLPTAAIHTDSFNRKSLIMPAGSSSESSRASSPVRSAHDTPAPRVQGPSTSTGRKMKR